ncbi:MAG: stage 0 sporulation family protein [Tissierellia bacterium]|nr:stage 0 sporulation family protein [Tissierellia bacterium]
MVEVVGVRFKPTTKIYYFSPQNMELKIGDDVIVETIRGVEYGSIVIENRYIDEEKLSSQLKPIIRVADELDKKIHLENKDRAKDAIDICKIKIKDHNLEMKLVDCEYTFDGQKLVFYFMADGRIDFRELVKDLAQIFRTRIELRQVGVRDQAKLMNGLGQCGQKTCCSRYLAEFQPVSIKMAKDQGLSLNPNKISGVCGRLMCCLKHEEEVYEAHSKEIPQIGSKYCTSEGCGTVCEQKILEKKIKVKLQTEDEEKLVEIKID